MATSRTMSGSDVNSVFQALVLSFEKERWMDVLESLQRVSEVGERTGQREISIQAQYPSAAIQSRSGRAETTPFRELAEQYDSLVAKLKDQLSHLIWTKEVSVFPKIG